MKSCEVDYSYIHQKLFTNRCADSCMLHCMYAVLQEVVPTCATAFGIPAASNITSNSSDNSSSTGNTTASSSCPSGFVLKANASTIFNPNATSCCVSLVSAATCNTSQAYSMRAVVQCWYLLTHSGPVQTFQAAHVILSHGCYHLVVWSSANYRVGEQLHSSCQVAGNMPLNTHST